MEQEKFLKNNKLKIIIENSKGSYKSFETEGDPVWNSYPLKGVTYPTDYGYLEGFQGEDGADLDIFVGTGNLYGYSKVWRLDVPTETKFFMNLSEQELQEILITFEPVLIESKILKEEDFSVELQKFKK